MKPYASSEKQSYAKLPKLYKTETDITTNIKPVISNFLAATE